MVNEREIYVIVWSYGDGSAFGIVRAYTDKLTAEDDFAMLNEQGSTRLYELQTHVEKIRRGDVINIKKMV